MATCCARRTALTTVAPDPRRRRNDEDEPRHLHAVTEDGELVTPAYVEKEIVRLSNNMSDVTDGLSQLAQDMANAEVNYKRAWSREMIRARATLDGDGPKGRVTVDQAESFAIEHVHEELLAHLSATAMYDVAKEVLRTTRSQVDALRTIAANQRAQS